MLEKRWIPLLALAVAVIATPGVLEANLICPECEPGAAARLDAAEVVDLVISTLLGKGISILIAVAAAIVGIPWIIAGAAVALTSLPGRLKSS